MSGGRAAIRYLPDGCRLHMQDGPIDLIVGADGEAGAVRRAYESAAERFVSILDDLCAELPLLRSSVAAISREPEGAIARRMVAAVRPFGESYFITPMAAVAGAVAECVLEAMCREAELRRAYVNNGGDIALHLGARESYRIGMVELAERESLFGTTEICGEDLVRGVATSGWRGRSFSLGIADAVTVLAESAAAADAAATVIANAVDLPGHAAITRVKACEITPDTDLEERLVTQGVGELRREEIARALAAGSDVAEELLEEGMICGVALSLCGERWVVGWRAGERRRRNGRLEDGEVLGFERGVGIGRLG